MIPNTSDRTDDDRRDPDRSLAGLATAAVIAVVLLVVAAPLVPGVVAQEDQPTVPASYYGDVTVNGNDADAGTKIVAIVDGEERGSIEISDAGSYGGPGALDDKLVVEGSGDDDGKTVTFEVRGVEAEETVEWESGDVQEVDLTFEDVPESDDGDDPGEDTEEDDGSAGGGGGGGGAAPAPEETAEPSETTTEEDATTPGPDEAIDGVEDVSGTEVVDQAQANISTDPETDAAQATFDSGSPVQKVEFDSESSVEGSVEVTEVSEPPAETGAPPGSTTTVTDIQVPADAEDAPATVEMRVSAERLAELDATAEDLRIHRYADGEWQPLETRVAEETDTGVVLAADTPGFSFFAASVVGEPDAELGLPADAVEPGTEVTLDGTGSADPYGEIVAYNWRVAGEELTGETASLALEDPGEYTVELVVRNDAGETDTATATLEVSDPESGGSSGETAADADGSDAGTAGSTGGSDDTVERETFGAVPSVWILGIGAVFVAVVLGLTVVLRRDDSPEERL